MVDLTRLILEFKKSSFSFVTWCFHSQDMSWVLDWATEARTHEFRTIKSDVIFEVFNAFKGLILTSGETNKVTIFGNVLLYILVGYLILATTT
jgi:hypothetical protein